MGTCLEKAHGFTELSVNEMQEINGGSFWSDLWNTTAAIFTIGAGAFTVAAAVLDPEPVSKTCAAYAGYCGIVAGISALCANGCK